MPAAHVPFAHWLSIVQDWPVASRHSWRNPVTMLHAFVASLQSAVTLQKTQ
jgi:hypothetical protein